MASQKARADAIAWAARIVRNDKTGLVSRRKPAAAFYVNGDRVRVDDCGKHHLGTVIRDDGAPSDFDVAVDRVWVKLDVGDNPIPCKHDELEAV